MPTCSLSPALIAINNICSDEVHSTAFARWIFDDGTEVVSRSMSMIDGVPVCVERWRMDRMVGESIVVPLNALEGRDDAGMLNWLSERLTILEDRIAGEERGFFAVHHGFTSIEGVSLIIGLHDCPPVGR